MDKDTAARARKAGYIIGTDPQTSEVTVHDYHMYEPLFSVRPVTKDGYQYVHLRLHDHEIEIDLCLGEANGLLHLLAACPEMLKGDASSPESQPPIPSKMTHSLLYEHGYFVCKWCSRRFIPKWGLEVDWDALKKEIESEECGAEPRIDWSAS